ncbi:MAG: rRNA (cytosine1962-C5)-methyltransferase [Verrucomicrobiota bacterium]
MVPCILFEDEHLLVVNKPAGLNTHAPSPFAGEGIYDWLRHREPRWANLAIIHRLDKETSGVMVFGKAALANRSLTEQFTQRTVQKKYLLLTDREPKQSEFTAKSKIIRAGDRYVSSASGEPAETRFQALDSKLETQNSKLIQASPLTGRTHQIRVHAAENGFPILGDTLYGGSNFGRVCLHAAELSFRHPATNELLTFNAPVDFFADPRVALRAALIDPNETNAFRIIHGASDGWPGWYVERFGEFLLSQSETELTNPQTTHLAALGTPSTRSASPSGTVRAGQVFGVPVRGTYHKILSRQVRRATPLESSPQLISGQPAPERFTIRENGVEFEPSFNEGYSVGLFLDQRDNRRRLLTSHVAADFSLFNTEHGTRNTKPELLNVFAYTCGFSVCAAKAGAKTTSLDLSKKYLEWGKRNFALNGLNPDEHDFIYGDAFDWMRRLAKKNRAFDVIVLDPPTFSQSKEHGAFRVEKDFGKLIAVALPLLKPDGIILASTNAADWEPEEFLAAIEESIRAGRRKILQKHYVPQSPDFPISRAEPAYLKTVWLRVG